jgi:hypothetical protein
LASALEIFTDLGQAVQVSGGTDAPTSGSSETVTVSGCTLPAVSTSGTPPTHCYVRDPAAYSELMEVTSCAGAGASTVQVTRGAGSTVPVTHAAGWVMQQVVSAAGYGSFPQRYNVRSPAFGAAGNGSTDDTTAIQAAITAAISGGGGIVCIPPGSYKTTSTITGQLGGTSVVIWMDPGAKISYYGSGDCLDIHDSSTYNSRTGTQRAGVYGYGTFDGSNITATAAGVHAGDILGFGLHASFVNWYGYAGCKGPWLDNRYYQTEQADIDVYAQSAPIVFDNSAGISGSANGSFERGKFRLRAETNGVCDGVTFQGGAFTSGQDLEIRGNFLNGAAQYYCLKLTGSNSAGYSGIGPGRLDTDVENDGGAGSTAPGTIGFGSGSNYISKGRGMLRFTGTWQQTTGTPDFLFEGPVIGDSGLLSYRGLDQQAFASAVSGNGQTIYTQWFPVAKVSNGGSSWTGLVMQAGAFPDQEITVYNIGAGTLTFAASGSNVADGASDAIPANARRTFGWDAGSNLWYRTA